MTSPWKEAGRAADRPQDSVSGTLRISDLVAPRKIPPGSGWRRLVHTMSFTTVNPG